MVNHIPFDLIDFEGTSQQLLPVVDGRALTSAVEEYERARKFDVVGGYGGLVLDHFNFGDLRQYLMGEQKPWPGQRVPLHGCNCGEWGCWPLVGTVARDERAYHWSDFEQPHRPARDYLRA